MTDNNSEYPTTVEGKYTTAKIFLPEDEIEELTLEQIQEMTDHEAFTEDIRVMADSHPGQGCVIGFSMPLAPKVIPNVVGVDIGCGMLAIQLDKEPEMTIEEMEKSLREAIPLGYHSHDEPQYHIGEDFPYEEASKNLASAMDYAKNFERLHDITDAHERLFEEYDIDYFKDLCERCHVDMNKAISQMGTNGGGNHFIEVSRLSSSGTVRSQATTSGSDVWLVFHSGSRALGNSVAGYWQDRATEYVSEHALDALSDTEVPEELRDAGATATALTDSEGNISMEKAASFCREQFDGEAIEANLNRIRQVKYDREEALAENRNTSLDYLGGEAAYNYLKDMIFAQKYAWENRRVMGELAAEALGCSIEDRIHSPHNKIDETDLVIRKGATRALDGERLIIPMNMAEGTLVCRGKGNHSYNRTAPHGAGRRGSRTWAEDTFSMDEYKASMEDVYSTSVSEDTLDEMPAAYKDTSLIEDNIGETVEVVGKLEPVINIKSEW